ncbi:Methenyltetrahydrofolate cyclohydrolase [Candidatus Izimaplasma bacterium HR1]|jgi:formiminotetrahydrofolate cyclodeaminase|uniref:cyclodeaminase/cyclohydrolase family protein n=1 Tax=Candidatus Izimoplasma sp. HR1 TaxID=1541959 RepID=UPI0004F865EC|nr:Methenyltetrahydrofolate cyclohydrolase [Candidatus Izimaplasma bacterium HR1]
MKLIELKVNEFINVVDSKSPAPGGGSVAALSGSLSSALANMVSHLTIGKKKFRALDEKIQLEVKEAMVVLESKKEEYAKLIDKDTEAFNMIMAAFKLPKETDEDKKIRADKIEEATIIAIEVPREVAENGKSILPALEQLFTYGNQNCLSDLGVSALLLHTTIIGAVMNMKINLSGLKCEDLVSSYQKVIDELTAFSNNEVLSFVNKVYNKL